MKKLIEWVEKEPSRARRVMLFSIIFTYLILTIMIAVAIYFGADMDKFTSYYYSFSSVAAIAIGFYAGTKPKMLEVPKEIKCRKDEVV